MRLASVALRRNARGGSMQPREDRVTVVSGAAPRNVFAPRAAWIDVIACGLRIATPREYFGRPSGCELPLAAYLPLRNLIVLSARCWVSLTVDAAQCILCCPCRVKDPPSTPLFPPTTAMCAREVQPDGINAEKERCDGDMEWLEVDMGALAAPRSRLDQLSPRGRGGAGDDRCRTPLELHHSRTVDRACRRSG